MADQSTAYGMTELVSAYALFSASVRPYPLAVLQATATQEGLTERDTQRPNDLLDVLYDYRYCIKRSDPLPHCQSVD